MCSYCDTARREFAWDQFDSTRAGGQRRDLGLQHGWPLTNRAVGSGQRQAEDEADLFNAGEAGHEWIERDALRPLGVSEERIRAIYFGNWQRDMSQAISPSVLAFVGDRATFLGNLVFEVLDVVAEAKFGQRLDRLRFGSYRWEEHIDNPREYGVAVDPRTYRPVPADKRRREHEPEAAHLQLHFWREGEDGLANYIRASRTYVLKQLDLAVKQGLTTRGLEHFGNAMHTVEDFYAHSNFIELGVHRLHKRGDVKTGHRVGDRAPLRDKRNRYRLTTGIFTAHDTAVSLQKLLLEHINTPQPGTKPSQTRVRVLQVLVRRLLGRTAAVRFQTLVGWWQRYVPDFAFLRELERIILAPLRRAITELLRPVIQRTTALTGRKSYPTPGVGNVVEISHSRLAKDDPHHHYHKVARDLGVVAVRAFWHSTNAAWKSSQRGRFQGADAHFGSLMRRYMNHPHADQTWWRPILCRVQPI